MEGESADTSVRPHVAVCPSVGMGHLAPFLTLASTLSSDCSVTLTIIVPLITSAESDVISSFFSTNPHILRLDFHVDLPSPALNADPFFLRYDSISRSAHRLAYRLSSLTPPLTAAFTDFFLAKGFNSAINPYRNYTLITTSARFLSLMAYLPHLLETPTGHPIEIPGLEDPFPADNIPPPFFQPDHIFTSLIVSNAQYFHISTGILVNTFDFFEPETLSAIRSGKALPGLLAPVSAVGPLLYRSPLQESDGLMSWLDEQPDNSVVYVSFGNRTTISREQMRELGVGLERSGYRFVWVVKTSMIDKEEKAEEELEDILGGDLRDKVCKQGKVIMRWVSQTEILSHKAVGGFVSHCGWNSVMEAARYGVHVVAWPQHGDQRENAGVVEKVGLGVWERGWGIGGNLVPAVEIADKVELVMGNDVLRRSTTWVREEAGKACVVDRGSASAALISIIERLKQNICTKSNC